MNVWQHLVDIHRTGDVRALVIFWGVVAALVLLIILQVRLAGSRRLAAKALDTARSLAEDLRYLTEQLDGLERRMEKRLDSRTMEIDARLSQKLDRKGDLIQERVEERTVSLADSVNVLDSLVSEGREQIERFRHRVDEVEKRMPNLFDRMEDFRDTMSRTFQAELGSVLNSFDSSVGGILQQMKSELQTGISRIEGIETIVRSRQRAQRSLLGPPEPPEVPEEAEQEGEFEEWEQEAKELAEKPEEGGFEEDLREIEAEAPEQGEQYPTDMEEAAPAVSEEPEPYEAEPESLEGKPESPEAEESEEGSDD